MSFRRWQCNCGKPAWSKLMMDDWNASKETECHTKIPKCTKLPEVNIMVQNIREGIKMQKHHNVMCKFVIHPHFDYCAQLQMTHVTHNTIQSMHVYSEVYTVVFSVVYSLESVHRSAAPMPNRFGKSTVIFNPQSREQVCTLLHQRGLPLLNGWHVQLWFICSGICWHIIPP